MPSAYSAWGIERRMAAARKALIVGGGLAGQTLATALARSGIAADLIELHPRWNVLGVGISVQGPTLRALRSIGLLDRCLAEGFGYSELTNCDRDGKVLSVVDLPRMLGPDYPSCVGIMRPVLHDVLFDAMSAAQVPVRMGLTLASLRQDPDGVDVVFSDGSQGRYDIVVGADGAYSKLRAELFGAAHRPQYTGQAVWRAMVPRPANVKGRHSYYGPRHKSGFNPVSQSEMYIYLVENVNGNPRIEPDAWAARMRALLQDFGGYIGEVRETITDPSRIVYRPVESLIMPKPWHQGRVVLIGDAVHTAPPQLASGAAIAIEDAIVLAEMLGGAGDVADILDRFVARRFERCRLVVENSYQLGEWEKNPGAAGADPAALQAASYAALAQPA
jgi:2-polyprenyl-6-methoxyphenol hydroxylase-like FAD-dependent oxidoreductase